MIAKYLLPILATIAALSSLAAGILGYMYVQAKQAETEAIEQCNADKITIALDAEKVTSAAQAKAFEKERAALMSEAATERRAAEIADEARRIAEARPVQVRTIIERIADENVCIDAAVPVDLLDCVFDGACGNQDDPG